MIKISCFFWPTLYYPLCFLANNSTKFVSFIQKHNEDQAAKLKETETIYETLKVQYENTQSKCNVSLVNKYSHIDCVIIFEFL